MNTSFKKSILLFIIYILAFRPTYGQVVISNGGFEEVASTGRYKLNLKNWFDCDYFSESPPDIHRGFFGVTVRPSEGNTYLGMVVRDNNTWESIAQFLKSPIIKDVCHEFTIDLCRSEIYKSASRFAGIKDYTETYCIKNLERK